MDADMAAIRLRVDALDAAIPCEMLCPISSDIMRAFAWHDSYVWCVSHVWRDAFVQRDLFFKICVLTDWMPPFLAYCLALSAPPLCMCLCVVMHMFDVTCMCDVTHTWDVTHMYDVTRILWRDSYVWCDLYVWRDSYVRRDSYVWCHSDFVTWLIDVTHMCDVICMFDVTQMCDVTWLTWRELYVWRDSYVWYDFFFHHLCVDALDGATGCWRPMGCLKVQFPPVKEPPIVAIIGLFCTKLSIKIRHSSCSLMRWIGLFFTGGAQQLARNHMNHSCVFSSS